MIVSMQISPRRLHIFPQTLNPLVEVWEPKDPDWARFPPSAFAPSWMSNVRLVMTNVMALTQACCSRSRSAIV